MHMVARKPERPGGKIDVVGATVDLGGASSAVRAQCSAQCNYLGVWPH